MYVMVWVGRCKMECDLRRRIFDLTHTVESIHGLGKQYKSGTSQGSHVAKISAFLYIVVFVERSRNLLYWGDDVDEVVQLNKTYIYKDKIIR